jgi:hypothetical protein
MGKLADDIEALMQFGEAQRAAADRAALKAGLSKRKPWPFDTNPPDDDVLAGPQEGWFTKELGLVITPADTLTGRQQGVTDVARALCALATSRCEVARAAARVQAERVEKGWGTF